MKKSILFIFLIIQYFSSFSQDTFEKGYFIKNSGEKVDCFIKNLDLVNNPKSFTYKVSMESNILNAGIEDIKVYEIYDIVKYERHNVKIDRSSEIISEISNTRKAEFNNEILFLKVLVEGKASLYQYSESNFLRFFYQYNGNNVEPLVFKSYTNDFSTTIKKNELYKQQILNNLNCEKITKGKIKKLKYRKAALTEVFVNYNSCTNSKYIDYTLENSKKTTSIVNLNIKSGINFSSFFLESGTSSLRDLNFNNKQTLRFGLELEYLMPFNNNKWAIIIEPTYNTTYKNTSEDTIGRETTVEYTSIEVPVGIRHYKFLNKNSKIFINASAVLDFDINSKITGDNNLDISTSLNYSFGFGYKYKNKISIEYRTFTLRDLLGKNVRVGDFSSSSLVLGYTLF